ncbi:solute carrier family 6 (neurotransmitter transporter, amino acid) member 5/7/9/14 [Mytilus galloprovincialis]|uniref:Transporter n=1 Tax=Mytilus galloprovincialis TaxID=29158 RepID=A0A8B6H3H6_MYTGA|nr:solute carrier family 6 (neurotransmitter transporter, amino acid) member 5/7/9/14 [Mytilus galloprovincialis]
MTNVRGNWKNWYEFLFSSIGCVVGLGNIWRFPYVCYKNGGGAFMIPYFIFLFILGIPVMFTELTYSQWSNLGPGRVWICCPLFRGIGFGMICLTGIVSIYYNVILAWALYYLVNSFYPTIPWSTCTNDYNTEHCYTRIQQTYLNMSINTTVLSPIVNALNISRKTATEEFWENKVLEITNGIGTPGVIRWQLVLCLLAAWGIAFLCLIKGIETSGKVVYVAATVPYVFLTILLIRGLLFDGATEGLLYFVTPRWEQLWKFSTWGDAAVQIFYSAGLGWGGVATLASYNNFHNNTQRDVIILLVLDGLTSFFAGCVIFVTLGFMAKQSGVHIDDVVAQGINRLGKDFEMMTGKSLGILWKIGIGLTTPFALLFVWIFSLVQHSPVTYGDQTYPKWSIGIGWTIALISLVPIPVGMGYTLMKEKGNIFERLRDSVKPLPSWRPANDDDHNDNAELEKLNYVSEKETFA